MEKTKLVICDEVNIRFTGLDISTRRKLVDKLKFFLSYARYTPAFKLGRWDGTVSFCDIGARSYLNLLDRLLPVVEEAGYDIEIEDLREEHNFEFKEITKDSYSHVAWPEGHPLVGQPIELREYQVDVVNSFLTTLQSLTVCPTAAGKTICTAIMSHKIEPYGRSIVIVPTKDLVTQTEDDYINLGLDVGAYFGDRKDWGKKHTICTWQSLEVLNKLKDGAMAKFLDDVCCVIVDEVHRSSADVLRKLLSGPMCNIPIRWGLTGTLPEEDHEKLAVHSCIGNTNGVIKAKDLQDQGFLSNLHVNVIQTKDYIVSFDSYQTELKWITTNKDRLDFLASYMSLNIIPNGNTLILVDRIETGKMLQERIPDSVFIYSKVKAKDRKEEYKSVQFNDGKVIIASYGVASLGISINRIFNLVLIEPGKSFVRVIQSIGRGLRIAEDKSFVNVYDITSNAKYAKRHLTKRKKFYKSADYPFSITKVGY